MSFEDIMKRMLPVLQGIYSPHITGSGSVPSIDAAVRNDYDKI